MTFTFLFSTMQGQILCQRGENKPGQGSVFRSNSDSSHVKNSVCSDLDMKCPLKEPSLQMEDLYL